MNKMGEHKLKGDQYLMEADKKSSSIQGLFGSLVGGSSKLEEAIDLYIKAANFFKMDKKWQSTYYYYYYHKLYYFIYVHLY